MSVSPESIERLLSWVDKVNEHFVRCKGEIHGDAKAWHDFYHDPELSNNLIYDFFQVVVEAYNENPRTVGQTAHSYAIEGQRYLNRYWHKPRCFDKGIGHRRVQPLFRNLMEVKDAINKIRGYEPPEYGKKPPPDNDDPTPFERLFDIDK